MMDADTLIDEVTCDVCDEVYSSENHKPVILPCGHTFCRPCLLQVKDKGVLKCPSCRKDHGKTSVDDLPLNFTVLRLSNSFQQMKEIQVCSVHSERKRFWCAECEVPVCALCIIHDHRGDNHEIVKLSEHFETKQVLLRKDLEVMNEQTQSLQSSAQVYVNNDIFNLLSTYKFSHDISEIRVEVNSYGNLLQGPNQISSVKTLNENIKVTQEKISTLLFHSETLRRRCNMKSKETQSVDEKSQKFQQCQGLIDNPLRPQLFLSDSFTMAAYSGDGRFAAMTWEESKLHISSFSEERINSQVMIDWSMMSSMLPKTDPEVFLELKTAGKYLGKVTFRLLGHLKRAQHFISLCLGSLGPSYSGMGLSETRAKEDAKFLVGGSYIGPDGCVSKRGLMDNLEWSGEYGGLCNKGRLVAFSNGFPELDASFAVIYEADQETFCNCPFGEVVSGFGVVIDASRYEPATCVTISRCGVMLPFQSIEEHYV